MASKYCLIAVILFCVILQGLHAQFRFSRRSPSRFSSRLSPRLPTQRLQRPRELSRPAYPLRTVSRSRSRISSSRTVPGRIRYKPRFSEVSVPSVRRTPVPRRGTVSRVGLDSGQREITPVRLPNGSNRLSPLSQKPWSLRVGQDLPGNFPTSRNIFSRTDNINNNNNIENIDVIRRRLRTPVATRTIQSAANTGGLQQKLEARAKHQLQNVRIIHAPLLPRRKGQVRYQLPQYDLPKVLTRQSYQGLTDRSVDRHAQYPQQQQQQHRPIISQKTQQSPLRPSVLFRDKPVKVGHQNAIPFQSTHRNAMSFSSVSKSVPTHVGHTNIKTGGGDGNSGTVVVQTRFPGSGSSIHSGQADGNVNIRTQVVGRTGQYNTPSSASNVEPLPVVVQTVQQQHADTIPLFGNGHTKVHTQIHGHTVQQQPVISSMPSHNSGHVQVQTQASGQMVDQYSPSLGVKAISVPLHDPVGIKVQTPLVGQPLQELVPSAPNTLHEDLVDAFTSVIESVLDPQSNVGHSSGNPIVTGHTSGHPIVPGQTGYNNIPLPIANPGVGVSHQGVVQSNLVPQQTGSSQFAPATLQGGMFASQLNPYSQFGQMSPYGYMSPWMSPAMMQEMMFGDTTDPPDGLTTTAAPLNISATNVTDGNGTVLPLAVDIVHKVDTPVTVATSVIDVIAHASIDASVNDINAQTHFKDTKLDIKASEKAIESFLNMKAPVEVILKAKDNNVDIKASTKLLEPLLNAETPVHVVVRGRPNTLSNDNGTSVVTVVEVNPGISSVGNVDVAVVDAHTITDTIVDNLTKPEVSKTKDLNTKVEVVQVINKNDAHGHNLIDLAKSGDIVQTVAESNKITDANIKVDISHVNGESKIFSETLSTIVDATADVKKHVVEVKLKQDSPVTVVTKRISDNTQSELKPLIKVQSKDDKSKQLIIDIASLIRNSKVDMGTLSKMITGQASSKVDMKPKVELFPTADQLGIKLLPPGQHSPIVHPVQRPTLPSATYTLQPKETPTIPPVPEVVVVVNKTYTSDDVAVDHKTVVAEATVNDGKLSVHDVVVIDNKPIVPEIIFPEGTVVAGKISASDVVAIDDKKVMPEAVVVVGNISASETAAGDAQNVVPEGAVVVGKISAPGGVVAVDDKMIVPEEIVVVGNISASDVVVVDDNKVVPDAAVVVGKISAPDGVVAVDDKKIVPEAAVVIGNISAFDVVAGDAQNVVPEGAVVVGMISASDVVAVDDKKVVPDAAVVVGKISASDVAVVDDKKVVHDADVVIGKISASDIVVVDKKAAARNPLPIPTLIPKGLVFTRQPEIYRTIRTILKNNPDALKKIIATDPTPTHHMAELETFKNIVENANPILNDQLPIVGHPKHVKPVGVIQGIGNKAQRPEPVRIKNLIDNTNDGSAPALVSILTELTNTPSKTIQAAALEIPVLSNVIEHSVNIEHIATVTNSSDSSSNTEKHAVANDASVNSTKTVDGAVLHEQLIQLNITDQTANAESGIDLEKYLSDPAFVNILRGMLQSMADKQQETTPKTIHPEPETTTFYPEYSTTMFPLTTTEEVELEDLVTVEP